MRRLGLFNNRLGGSRSTRIAKKDGKTSHWELPSKIIHSGEARVIRIGLVDVEVEGVVSRAVPGNKSSKRVVYV